MIGLIAEMFWSLEAQPDAYVWAVVLLAHAAVGAVLVALASLLTRRPVLAVSLAYGLIWEGGQLALAGAGLADSVLDWAAVTLGAWAGVAAWRGKGNRLAALLAAAAAVIWVGVRRRK